MSREFVSNCTKNSSIFVMKQSKHNLLKAVLGVGLAIAPLSAKAQNTYYLKSAVDVVTGGGVSYALGVPVGVYDVMLYGDYGVKSKVFANKNNFHGFAMVVADGAVSNRYYDGNHSRSYKIGGVLKAGCGYHRFSTAAGKGLVLAWNRDEGIQFINTYSLGVLVDIGRYTQIYADYVWAADAMAEANKRNLNQAICVGVLYTLRRTER